MSDKTNQVESDRQLLAEAQAKGTGFTLWAFFKMSGPGWLQSAITLGGGSLASSLYLGVIGGFALLWVQPFAMVLGIIMLSAIGYVTLSTEEQPFRAINEHVNPVLGWGWALAVAMANVVWCMPQYSLANGALGQNLLPKFFGNPNDEGTTGLITQWATGTFGEQSFWATHLDELIIAISILTVATIVTWSYDRGGWGLKLYETILKIVVALIVLSFIGVVIKLSVTDGGLAWGSIFSGFIPDFSTFIRPTDSFLPLLEAIGPEGDPNRKYWVKYIVDQQQDVMISAAATAVGINMTFLFAYSLLRKGWSKEFRGLVKFDLATGMLVPFLLATSCIVVAAASQFHTKVAHGFLFDGEQVTVPKDFKGKYDGLLGGRNKAAEAGAETDSPMANEPSLSEKKLAATLVKRDNFELAHSLKELFQGDFWANVIFGFGVLAMTLSTITILMLISGFVFTEMLGLPPGGWPHRIGTLIAGIGGAFGPFIWKGAAAYLVVPTSVFGFVLLPVAYFAFFLLMNQKKFLGANAPTGGRRIAWNVLMGVAASIAAIGSVYMAHKKAGLMGVGAIAAFVLVAVIVHFNRVNTRKHES